jgi:hypothetical protein
MRNIVRFTPWDLPQGGQIWHDVRLAISAEARAGDWGVGVRSRGHAALREADAAVCCIPDAGNWDDSASAHACNIAPQQPQPFAPPANIAERNLLTLMAQLVQDQIQTKGELKLLST